MTLTLLTEKTRLGITTGNTIVTKTNNIELIVIIITIQ